MLRLCMVTVVFLAACSVGPSTDLVSYLPVHEIGKDGIRTRSLLITGTRMVLGVERKFDGGVGVRVGTVSDENWELLRTRIAGARHLRTDTTPPGLDTPTFQITARLGDDRIKLVRDPRQPLEGDVAGARDRLEMIWDATSESADPIADVKPFLESFEPKARGLAAQVLLKLWNRPETKAAAEKALRAYLEVEEDRKIVHAIRDVIDQPETE